MLLIGKGEKYYLYFNFKKSIIVIKTIDTVLAAIIGIFDNIKP